MRAKKKRKPLNKNIGIILKEYRKKNNYTMDEVVPLLHEAGLTATGKTVYGWESNQAHPTTDDFIRLCMFYGIKDLKPFYEGEKPLETLKRSRSLSAKEFQVIMAYRNHPELQQVIDKLLDINTDK